MSTEEEKFYTIGDIAQELGVSKTTVSRAISGKGRISEATRERILEFTQQHDYRPNALAKALAKSRTYNVGLILPAEYADTEFRFFRDCMNGICETATASNYDVVISMTDGQDLSQIHRLIANRKVDGIILSRSTTDSQVQAYLKEKRIPFVVIGPTGDPEVPCVDNQNQEAARELTGIMLMKGVQRLAVMGGSRSHLVTESRLQGFLEAHRQAGREYPEPMILLDVDNYVKAARAVDQILNEKIGGLICMDDFITGLALGCLRERGIRIPEDIKLASMYDSSQLEHNVPSVTSLWFDTKALGARACRMLLNLLGEETEEELSSLEYQAVFRESTK